ncbi:putative pectate lyase [Serratia phage vB_SmaA_3M]|uniref:Putative pectate lyase n=1 Tax=Serratia phage vB_SmaA_3M TaxID=2419930 RepID=A0A3G2YS21_9CAUD|nr:putative pectate lyase [Serratia phage vB_SmaA_3M]AYP28296.1 putative pectate lyase [Serratia phage vB_SmaA_3M]
MSQTISSIMQLPVNMNFNKVVMVGRYAGIAGTTINGPDSAITNNYRLVVEQVSVNTQTIYQRLEYRLSGTVRLFGRFGTNSTGSDPIGSGWNFTAWEEFATPANGFTTGATVKAGRLESTGQVVGTYVGSSGRVVAGTSVEGATATFTGVVTCSSVNQTSDQNLKEDIVEIPKELIEAAKSVSPKQYRFKGDESGIMHVGFMAQEVWDAILAVGLNPEDYALVGRHEDGEGNTIFSINYTELMLLRSL